MYRFVMKADGMDFRAAYLCLKAQSGVGSAESGVGTYDSRLQTQDFAWLERAVDHYHARLLETPAAQDYLRPRGIMAAEIATSFHLGYADGTLAEKLPAEGCRALRRIGVLTGSGRELMRGCVIFPLVNAATGQVVNLYTAALKVGGICTCRESGGASSTRRARRTLTK